MITELLEIETQLQQLVSTEQAWHYRIIPKSSTKDEIIFFISEQFVNHQAFLNELEILFGKKIGFDSIPEEIIQKNLTRYYRRTISNHSDAKKQSINVKQNENFLTDLIREAKQLSSSDIHIETYEDKCRVRIRIDGILIERFNIEKDDYPALINKIKILANLDISEKRLPQDGRIFFKSLEQKFDIRVSVLPTLYGEKIVLRLLGNDANNIDINELGFTSKDLENYIAGIKKPHGIVLISGPTGSGKTTTLYATLKILNQVRTNIITIEDPIEYTLPGINQVQLRENIGLTFAHAIRTFLRQDPDVIMLGEIRDSETAQMAIRAALTGHLVLSTIHTNSAWSTVSRLSDMGIPPFLVAGTLNTTVAQRLVKLLCNVCKEKSKLEKDSFPHHFNSPHEVHEHFIPKGCEACYYTGYKGRKAIYEVISMDRELLGCVRNNQFEIDEILKRKGIETLQQNAFELFINGETSLEEIYPLLSTAH